MSAAATSADRLEHQGGCLCGALRYRISAALSDTGFCHCRLCQRASGSPAVVWTTVAVNRFAYTQGEPARFASSAGHWREFCAGCGTPLVFRTAGGETVDVAAMSLDQPANAKPVYHIWTASQWPHLQLDDGLPQYEDAGPDA